MAHTAQIDTSAPANTDLMGRYAQYLRELKRDIGERFDLDHYIESSQVTTLPEADGYHRQVNMKSLTVSPTIPTDAGVIYDYSSGGVQSLKYENSSSSYSLGKNEIFINFADVTVDSSPPGGTPSAPDAESSYTFSDSFRFISPSLVPSGGASINADGESVDLPAGNKIIYFCGSQRIRVQSWVALSAPAAELFINSGTYLYDETFRGGIDLVNIYLKDQGSGIETQATSQFFYTTATSIKIKVKATSYTQSFGASYPFWGARKRIYLTNLSAKVILL